MSNQINSYQFSYGIAPQRQDSLPLPPSHGHEGILGGMLVYERSGNNNFMPRQGETSYGYCSGTAIEQRPIQQPPPPSSAYINVRESVTTTVRREVTFERDATPDDILFFSDAMPKNNSNGNNAPYSGHLTCIDPRMMHPAVTVPAHTLVSAMLAQQPGQPSEPLLPSQSFTPTHNTASYTTSLHQTFGSTLGVMPHGPNNQGTFTFK